MSTRVRDLRGCFLCLWPCVGLLWGCGSTAQQGNRSSASSAGSSAHAGGEAAQSGGGASLGGSGAGSDDNGAAGHSAGNSSSGGSSNGGSSSSGGSSNSGGSPMGGTGATKHGCVSSLEEMKDSLCVAKLVPVTGGYWIDATEVTRGQYQSWLATSPTLDPTCMPKTSPSYEPDAKCVASLKDNTDDPEHLPQTCVDWCDAAAYCKGAGKRLCGKIGGGTNPYDKFADATASQWFNACSSGGVNTYPYGGTHSPTACNGYDNPNPGSDFLPVGALPTCQSSVDGYEGVYDLSGNVHEWEDSCQGAGTETVCRVRGGSVVSALECAADGVGFMTNPGQSNFGIRCCKD